MSWEPITFDTAAGQGFTLPCAGYGLNGLGLYQIRGASPKGRRAPLWCLVHLNTGHAIAHISGFVADAFPVATAVAECSDWTFAGLYGWKNTDPELPAKVHEIAKAHPRLTIRGGPDRQDEAAAQRIGVARA